MLPPRGPHFLRQRKAPPGWSQGLGGRCNPGHGGCERREPVLVVRLGGDRTRASGIKSALLCQLSHPGDGFATPWRRDRDANQGGAWRLAALETAAFDHSATSPLSIKMPPNESRAKERCPWRGLLGNLLEGPPESQAASAKSGLRSGPAVGGPLEKEPVSGGKAPCTEAAAIPAVGAPLVMKTPRSGHGVKGIVPPHQVWTNGCGEYYHQYLLDQKFRLMTNWCPENRGRFGL